MTRLETQPVSTSRTMDFAVTGAQKCATSWLYYCLRDHPGICVPDKKLEAGYIGGAMFAEQVTDWFFGRVSYAGEVQSVFRFLGVDDRFRPPSLAAAPKRNAYNPRLLALEHRFAGNRAVAKLLDYANQAILTLRPKARGDVVPPKLRQYFDTLLAPTIDETLAALARLPAGQRPAPDRLREVWGRDHDRRTRTPRRHPRRAARRHLDSRTAPAGPPRIRPPARAAADLALRQRPQARSARRRRCPPRGRALYPREVRTRRDRCAGPSPAREDPEQRVARPFCREGPARRTVHPHYAQWHR